MFADSYVYIYESVLFGDKRVAVDCFVDKVGGGSRKVNCINESVC